MEYDRALLIVEISSAKLDTGLLRMLTGLFNSLRSQNFLMFTGELFILILGVFLALQVDTWNEQRKANSEATEYLIRLERDYLSIRDRVENIIAEYDREIAAAIELGEISRNPLEKKSLTRAEEIMEELLFGRSPVQRSATYIEMLEGNKLDLIQDVELVENLVRCDSYIIAELSNYNARGGYQLEFSRPLMLLSLDARTLPFSEALEIALPESLDFQRALTITEAVNTSGRIDNEGILECASKILNRLSHSG